MRSTMKDSRLNACMTLHIYKDRTAQLDPQEIICSFVGTNRRRAERIAHSSRIKIKMHIDIYSCTINDQLSQFESASASFSDEIALNSLAPPDPQLFACRCSAAAPSALSKPCPRKGIRDTHVTGLPKQLCCQKKLCRSTSPITE